MNRFFLFGFLLFHCLVGWTQPQRGYQGMYDVTDFPTVSFVWNSADPDLMEADRFALSENGEPLAFSLQALPVDQSVHFNKSILILWEDMVSHSRQTEFTRQMLTRFFRSKGIQKSDCFNIAVFNRNRDSKAGVLTLLMDHFSNNPAKIVDALDNYRGGNETFSDFPMQSDLYMAINEGVDILKKQPLDRAGVIIVVTAGLNMKASGASTEMETVRRNALEAGIPVYVIKYPISGNTPEVNILAKSTYGLVASTVQADSASNALSGFYGLFDRRLYGRSYQFTFTTSSQRDGKMHRLRFLADRVDYRIPPYKAPNPTLGQWLSSHIVLVALLVVLLAGIVLLVLYLVKNSRLKRHQFEEDLNAEMLQKQRDSEMRSHDIIEGMRREQEAKEFAAKQQQEQERREEETLRLTSLMQSKNLYPRLQCKVGNSVFSYSITKPRVTLGRNDDNDVAFSMRSDTFDNMTVSGLHAEIVFDGADFMLVNLSQSYTQGIIVNGQLAMRHPLRGGDVFCLGEAVISFYL
ncbi:MAG: FHA domain-containing protein [Bacteroidales bacterium]|nr:FHA domain-containing protein [Bacteroidales bacterium]MBR0539945.1 FHA domain-containing protein [Bacteroidales bacterium]